VRIREIRAIRVQNHGNSQRAELSLTFDDVTHSGEEDRFIDIGRSSKGYILVVVYTERGNNIRVIT
jgi:uncharacterized DUF497 family protein